MKKKLLLLIMTSLLLLGGLPLWAQRSYMSDEAPTAELQRLYTLAGRAFPISAFPLTGEQLSQLAEELIKTSDNAEIRHLARRLADSLRLPATGAQWGQDIDATLEGNLHDPYRWDPARSYQEHFIQLPDLLEYGLFSEKTGYPGIYISAGIKREYAAGNLPESNLFIAGPDDPFKIETSFIKSGYIWWNNDNLSFRLGRSPVHYGDRRFSSFLPSDRLPFLDAMEFRYKIGPLQLVSYFATLENRMSEAEKDYFLDQGQGLSVYGEDRYLYADEDGWLWESDSAIRPGDLSVDPNTEQLASGFSRTIILNSMHRFLLEFPRVSFALTGHMLIAREQNAIHLADIFPVFSWHNGFVGSNNMCLLLDGLWNIRPGLDLYAQAGWDDINATDLMGIPDNGLIPTIGAYLLGLGYEGGSSLPVSASLELGYSHYLWGNFYAWSKEAKTGMYFARAIYRFQNQRGVHLMPLSSPYGPGCIWIDGKLHLGSGLGLSSDLSALYLSRIRDANLYSTEYQRSSSLKNGERVDSLALSASLRYTVPLKKTWRASLYSRLNINSYDGIYWPEIELGCRLKGSVLRSW